MPQDAKILAAAFRRFQADKARREAELDRRMEELGRRLPRVAEIDRELRTTAAQIVLAAFENDEDPTRALAKLEEKNLALQQEQARLLAQAGYPGDYIDNAPRCPLCQDSGYQTGGAPCRCLMAYYTREQNRRLSKLLNQGDQSFDAFSLDWYSPQVWSAYGCSPLENMEMIRDICLTYARTFSPRSGNLLFTGAPGLGKTFLSACIAREVSGRGFSVVYDTARHIFQQFEREKFGRESAYEEAPDREINRYLNCDLLIMDDLGTEMLSPFVESAFYQIVNERLLGGGRTVLSTNLTPEGISARYGEAVLSRIQGEYQILRFFGEDIRILKRDQ